MKSSFKVSLKAGEKIYINGAVVRVERKTTLEFLNDVQFLMEGHVMQADQATTPLRQLYFAVQIMLMAPRDAEAARDMFRKSMPLLLATFESTEICNKLKLVDRLVGEEQIFEALRTIRSLFPLEAEAFANPTERKGAADAMIPVARAIGE
ncbi:MAG: flagellar biosynthesis repressor FlbT [Rhizobiales bacterium]|nr:flagellar biosynthesis repressor FlbT [Hyphomicrobiales bacterium]